MTVLLVTGARSLGHEDLALVRGVLAYQHALAGGGRLTVFVGDASGVDAVVRAWAEEHGFLPRVYEADWKAHGKAAGPKRNQVMVASADDLARHLRTDLVALAFPGPRSTGTWDCMKRIVAHGREIDRVVPVGRGS